MSIASPAHALILAHEDMLRCMALDASPEVDESRSWQLSLYVSGNTGQIEGGGEVARSEFAAGEPGSEGLLLLRLGDPTQPVTTPNGHRPVAEVLEAALASRWPTSGRHQGAAPAIMLGLGPGIPPRAQAALRAILEGDGSQTVSMHASAVLATAGLADRGVFPIGHRVLVLEAAFGNAYLTLVTVGPPTKATTTLLVDGAGALPTLAPLADLLMAAAAVQAAAYLDEDSTLRERARLLPVAARLAPTFAHGHLEAMVGVSNTPPMRVTVREEQLAAQASQRRNELDAAIRTLVHEHQADHLLVGLGMDVTEADCRRWIDVLGAGRVHLLGPDAPRVLAEGTAVVLAGAPSFKEGQLQASVLSISRNTVVVRLASGQDALLEGAGTGVSAAGWLRPGTPVVVRLESSAPRRVSLVRPPRTRPPVWPSVSAPSRGRIVARLEGHDGPVTALATSPHGGRIISAGQDGEIRLWDSDTGTLDRMLSAHSSWVSALACSADRGLLASAGKDKTIRVWDLHTGLLLTTLATHRAWVQALTFSPDGAMLYGGGTDGDILRWEVSAGGHPEVLPQPPRAKRAIRHMAYLEVAGALLLTGRDHTPRLLPVADAPRASGTPSFLGHTTVIRGLATSHDGASVLTGDASGLLHHWRIPEWHPTALAPSGQPGVEALAMASRGHWAVSGHATGQVRAWDLERGIGMSGLEVHDGPVSAITLLAEEGRIATAGLDGSVTIVELWTPAPSCLHDASPLAEPVEPT